MPGPLETRLAAFAVSLSSGVTAPVARNEVVPVSIASGGLVHLHDAAPVLIGTTFSPLLYHYDLPIEVCVYVQEANPALVADGIRQEIAAVVNGDRTLSGLCDWVEVQLDQVDTLQTGGAPIRAETLRATLTFATETQI